jgi:hypothetical protein
MPTPYPFDDPEFLKELQSYSEKLAALAVDALLDANIVARSDFEEATQIAATEIYVRFFANDWPPRCGPVPKDADP